MFNENIDRRTALKFFGLSGVFFSTLIDVDNYSPKTSIFEKKWDEKYKISSEVYLKRRFSSISKIKQHIKTEQNNNEQTQVLGIFLTKTEFALLAYLKY